MSKKPARKRKGGRARARVDWARVRLEYEQHGESTDELGRRYGVAGSTVRRRKAREGWREPHEVARERAERTGEEILKGFIDRDAEAIRANLEKKHEATSLVLKSALGHAKRLHEGTVELLRHSGDVVVREDPLLSLRRVALVLQTVEVIDRSLAGLKDDGWRSASGRGGEDSDSHEAEVRKALDALE